VLLLFMSRIASFNGEWGWQYAAKIIQALQQRKFLIKCRKMDLLPPHIYNIRFVASLRSSQLNRKYISLKKNYQKRLLNLEIKDIHSQLNYIRIRLEGIERYLRSKILATLLENFFESRLC